MGASISRVLFDGSKPDLHLSYKHPECEGDQCRCLRTRRVLIKALSKRRMTNEDFSCVPLFLDPLGVPFGFGEGYKRPPLTFRVGFPLFRGKWPAVRYRINRIGGRELGGFQNSLGRLLKIAVSCLLRS